MSSRFSLKWAFIAVTLVACSFGSFAAGRVQGLLIYLCILAGLCVLFAPGRAAVAARGAVILMGIGAGVVSWCVLHGLFGRSSLGIGWYGGGYLDELGGWAAGLLAASWRASHLLLERGND